MVTNEFERDLNDQAGLKRPGRVDFRVFQNTADAGDGNPGVQRCFRNYLHEGGMEKDIDLIAHGIIGTSVNINNAELQQLSNIGTTTISETQWGYLGELDQPLKQADSPTFAALTINGNITITGNVDGVDVSVLKTAFDALNYYTQAEVDDHNWLEADITDLDKYTQAQVDALNWTEADITDLDKYTVAEVNALLATHHDPVSTDHDDRYYTEAEINAFNAIGVANKRWSNNIFGGEGSATKNLDVFDAIRNVGDINSFWVMEIPLDTVIGGTHNLVITKIRIGITKSDSGNWIDRIRISAWNTASPPAYAGLVDIDHNAVHGTGAGKFEHDHADQTIGGTYERAMILIDANTTPAAALEIAYVQVEYYYT